MHAFLYNRRVAPYMPLFPVRSVPCVDHQMGGLRLLEFKRKEISYLGILKWMGSIPIIREMRI